MKLFPFIRSRYLKDKSLTANFFLRGRLDLKHVQIENSVDDQKDFCKFVTFT